MGNTFNTFAGLAAGIGLALPATASAGTKPLIQPTPEWVAAAPAIASLPRGAGDTGLLIFDQQQRLDNGEVWSYIDRATRITSEAMLTQAGTINLQWQPEGGDLIVHTVAIVRDGKTIDLLADPEPFTILRRERGLEQLMIDGVLTATMAVKGLQVDDVLRVTFSTTHSDPVLKGGMQSSALLLSDPARAGFARERLLWKGDKVRWKALADIKAPKLAMVDGFHELTVILPLAKQPDTPADAPLRYRPLPLLEASSFADWQEVSKVMAPLYRTAGTIPPGSPLAREVARIKAATTDPRTRTAMALQTVQSEVRYLFNGLNNGNYVPQTPEKTWTVRYGDCKAKTMLLLALLSELGITAEPVLAHIQIGDYLPKRLPSAGAFNHILVRATIGGQSLFLDGTATGARLADLDDTPNFRFVLPVRSEGATLEPIVTRANARAIIEVDDRIDQTAGIGIVAPFSATLMIRGGLADTMKAAAAQVSTDKKNEIVDRLVGELLHPALLTQRDIDYDPATATAVLRVAGLVDGDWAREDQRYEWTLDRSVNKIGFDGNRARSEWRDIPVATTGILTGAIRVTVSLPDRGKGFELEGDKVLPSLLAGTRITRSVTNTDGIVTLNDRIEETAVEIAPADLAAVKARLTQAKSRLLKIVAPRDYPRRWQVITAAQKSGRLQPIEAAYAQIIAAAPEKPPAYLSRAKFRTNVFDRKGAIADLDKVIAERPSIEAYRGRAGLHYDLRQDAKALADAKAAYALDPGSEEAVTILTSQQADQGERDAALTLLDERIAAGGDQKVTMQQIKAEILARGGNADDAIALLSAAMTTKPGDGGLLNSRCWLKGTLGVQLDTALKDCTRAIELGRGAQALDSRAMVYFKLQRWDDALADLDAALDARPEQAGSLFLRAAVLEKRGTADPRQAVDLAGARLLSPRIDEEYARYGVKLASR